MSHSTKAIIQSAKALQLDGMLVPHKDADTITLTMPLVAWP